MQIDAPFTINIINNDDSQSRELHLKFIDSFRNLLLAQRVDNFKEYMTQLNNDLSTNIDDQTRQGMLTILQISEQLLPHIIDDEIPLEDEIIIEMGPASPFDNIINSATLK